MRTDRPTATKLLITLTFAVLAVACGDASPQAPAPSTADPVDDGQTPDHATPDHQLPDSTSATPDGAATATHTVDPATVLDAATAGDWYGVYAGTSEFVSPALGKTDTRELQLRIEGSFVEGAMIAPIHVINMLGKDERWTLRGQIGGASIQGFVADEDGENVGVWTATLSGSGAGKSIVAQLQPNEEGPSLFPWTATFTASLVEQVGQCCTADGCTDATDQECVEVGGGFVDETAAECCVGGECEVKSAAECEIDGGSQATPKTGACCSPAGCMVVSEAQCDGAGGTFAATATCADGNNDGSADICEATGLVSCGGTTTIVSCVINEDDDLEIGMGALGTLTLAGTWSASEDAANEFGTNDAVTIETVAGDIAIPDVGELVVNCDGGLLITGSADALPAMDQVAEWSSTAVTTSTPSITIGMAYGKDLTDLGAPVAACSQYLTFSITDGATVQVDGAKWMSDMHGFMMLINPFDPSFYVQAYGFDGPVKKVGVGVSRQGLMTWHSVQPMWNGAGTDPQDDFATQTVSGHIYQNGKFSLIPVPKLPANINLDGDLVIDLGDYEEKAEAVVSALVSEDFSGLDEDLFDDFRIAANAKALELSFDGLNFKVGSGSFVADADAVTFRGDSFSPLDVVSDVAGADFDKLATALSALTIRNTSSVHGVIDHDTFTVMIDADITAGPFVLDDTRIIIDSDDGLRIEGGSAGFDFMGFIETLSELMTCDFSDGASCNFLGATIDLVGEKQGKSYVISADIDLLGLAGAGFESVVGDDGDFELTVTTTVSLGVVEIDGTLTIEDTGVAFSGEMLNMGVGIAASGSITFGGGDVSVAGTISGSMQMAGFTLAEIGGSFDNDKVSIFGSIDSPVGSADMVGTFWFASGDFSLTGDCNVSIADMDIVSATLTLSNSDGLEFEGKVSLMDVIRSTISGEVKPSGYFKLSASVAVELPIDIIDFSAKGVIEFDPSKKGASKFTLTAEVTAGFGPFDFEGDITFSGYKVVSLSVKASLNFNMAFFADAAEQGCKYVYDGCSFLAAGPAFLCNQVAYATKEQAMGGICYGMSVAGNQMCTGVKKVCDGGVAIIANAGKVEGSVALSIKSGKIKFSVEGTALGNDFGPVSASYDSSDDKFCFETDLGEGCISLDL